MATVNYPFEVRDSTVAAGAGADNRKTGLTPSVILFKPAAAAAGTILALPAVPPGGTNCTVEEVGGGQYRVLYDPAAHGEAFVSVDCGAALTDPNDRWKSFYLAADPSLLQTNLNAKVGDVLTPVLATNALAQANLNAPVGSVKAVTDEYASMIEQAAAGQAYRFTAAALANSASGGAAGEDGIYVDAVVYQGVSPTRFVLDFGANPVPSPAEVTPGKFVLYVTTSDGPLVERSVLGAGAVPGQPTRLQVDIAAPLGFAPVAASANPAGATGVKIGP